MSDNDQFLATFQEWIDLFMHRSMRRFIQYARKNNLSLSMMGALFHLHKQEKAGVGDLGEHLGVTSAAASQMLDRLVQQELIQRTENPDDRRLKHLVITPKGCQVLEESMQLRQSWLAELAESLTIEERQLVKSAFNLLITKAQLSE